MQFPQKSDYDLTSHLKLDKVKETTVPEGAFGISAKGKAEALNNRINAASNITGIPENLPEGSFGISEAGAREALTNRFESQTGIPANLPEGSFNITPKKKFKIPNISPAL